MSNEDMATTLNTWQSFKLCRKILHFSFPVGSLLLLLLLVLLLLWLTQCSSICLNLWSGVAECSAAASFLSERPFCLLLMLLHVSFELRLGPAALLTMFSFIAFCNAVFLSCNGITLHYGSRQWLIKKKNNRPVHWPHIFSWYQPDVSRIALILNGFSRQERKSELLWLVNL